MKKMQNKTKVVIVGGGFGGVYTAKNLCKLFSHNEIEITLFNKSNYFLFTPLLHEVATGGLSGRSIVESIREVFRGTGVFFVEDVVVEIDYKNRNVRTSHQTFDYDYLVLSNGAETCHFGTPGAIEHTFSLKTLPDAIALRNHILETCEVAVKNHNKDLLVSAIVGAGPTGVELAAEMKEYMEHTLCTYYRYSGFSKEDIKLYLITATSDVISQFPQKMRDVAMVELNKKGIKVLVNSIVTKVESNQITFKDEKVLKAHTIVWVAGVAPNLGDLKNLDQGVSMIKSRIEVNKYLQSTLRPEVFALGDVAGTSPMLAQVAVQQGKIVARNICSLMNGDTMFEFKFTQKGLLLSIGQWYAIGSFFGVTIRGRIMWLLWRLTYLANFLSWKKRFSIVVEWTQNFFQPRDITYLR